MCGTHIVHVASLIKSRPPPKVAQYTAQCIAYTLLCRNIRVYTNMSWRTTYRIDQIYLLVQGTQNDPKWYKVFKLTVRQKILWKMYRCVT